MEEEQPEQGQKQESEPPGGGVERCGRHPSQLLTGICSSCLMERLSSVRNPAEAEIVEVGAAGAGEGSSAGADPGKLRKTLMLLFQLDDSGGVGAAHPPEAKDPQVAEFEVDPGGGGGSRGAKWKGGSWLRSILPRRGMRWRRKEPSRPPREGSVDPGGDAQVERKPSFRRSCEWMVCREPSRGSLEPPRHSWDGSMVGRAFACSFACLEEPPDGARRARWSNAEEAVGESPAGVAESRNGGHFAGMDGEGQRFRGRSCGDAGREMTVSGVGRRRSNRWSRVWDRSITSPSRSQGRKPGGAKMGRQQTSTVKFSLAAMGMVQAEQAKAQSEARKLQLMGTRRISAQIGLGIRNARLAGAGVCIILLLGTWIMGCCGFI